MTQTTRYLLYRVLAVVAGLRGCLAIDMDPELNEMNHFRNLPYKDREFLKEYIKFSKTMVPMAFYPIVVVCIVLGIVGNACFLFFFTNRDAKIYKTKDGLFFRRMPVADLLVCVIVLPYAITFEARIITHNLLCRSMEFVRHTLIYSSHLLLTFYSLEFNTRDSYRLAKERFNRTTIFVVIASVVLAMPTLILFEAGNPYSFYEILEDNVSRVQPIVLFPVSAPVGDKQVLPSGLQPDDRLLYFNPKFCHLNLNTNTKASSFDMLRYITTWYTMMHGFIFFVCSFTLVAQIITLMESNPFFGRESMFVNVIEQTYPELTCKLRRLEIANAERRIQKRSQRGSMKTVKGSSSILSEHVGSPDDAEDINSVSTFGDPAIFGHSVDPRLAKPNIQVKPNIICAVKVPRFDDEDVVDPQRSTQKGTATQETHVAHTEFGKVQFSNENGANLPLDDPSPMAAASPKRVNWSCEEEAPKGVSLCQYLCSCQAFKPQGKTVRLLGSTNQSQRSFKYSIMCLIMIDLLVLCAATVGYLISDEMSFILNLVNFKSVFSFLILSLINDNLYNVTWSRSSTRW